MAAPTPTPGQILGHFRLIEKIGAGAIGIVYRAWDTRLERDVAVKVLNATTLSDVSAQEHFRSEALILSRLNHPNIESVYDFHREQGVDYLVMEYVPGTSLDERLERGALSEKEVVAVGIQLAQGLAAAHAHRVIHRDLKPGNLRVTPDNVLKILDFGLAQLFALPEDRTLTTAVETQRLLHPFAGTPAYLSPEQLQLKEPDTRSDIYSAGVVLYELATGSLPFTQTGQMLADAILHSPPPAPRLKNKDISRRLEAVILKCMAKDSMLRYQSANELLNDLKKLSSGSDGWRMTIIALIAAVLAAVLITAGATYLHRGSKFHEKDTVVLADFHNQTGESGWDDTLKLALTNELGNSNYLNILPERRVSETLKMMKHQPDEPLTTELATQVCLRNGIKAFLTGSIAKVGAGYHLDLRATNCATGAMLASADADAESKEKVIAALKTASNKLRQNLGESLASVEKYSTPLPQVTSASLEALQEYAKGLRIKAAEGSAAAVPFYKRSIELDPEFAEAYAALGAAYSDMGEDSLWMENSRKAYELRDHVSSQRERLHIEADYYDSVTGEAERANQTYLEWIQSYPDDHRPHQNLGTNYSEIGQFDKAIDQEQIVRQLQPNNVNGFAGLMGDYIALDEPGKVTDIFEQARQLKLDNKYIDLYRYYAAFLQGDATTMQKQVEWSIGRPGTKDALLSAQSDTEAFYGRFERARSFTQRAAQSAKNADMAETAAEWMANAAMREAEVGNKVQARVIANEALAVSRGIDVELQVALALARAGQLAEAKKIVAELDTEYPRNTMVQNYWLPTIRAAIELQNKNANKALELLEQTVPYEMGTWYMGHLYPAYLRGEAYLKLGRGQEAAEEFQKVLDHRGVVLNFVTGSLAYLQLGRAAAIRSDTASARKEYEGFLGLWKNADSNLPVLKAAQGEYQRLAK